MDDNSKDAQKPARACDACYDAVFPLLEYTPHGVGAGTTHAHLTLSGLKSMPSLVLGDSRGASPAALLAVDLALESPKRVLTRIEDDESAGVDDGEVPAIRVRAAARPRSYVQILQDFQQHAATSSPSPSRSHYSAPGDDEGSALEDSFDGNDSTMVGSGASLTPTPRKENTARRHKRFSLPAVALQTNSVTARPNLVGEGSARRFSLVLGRGSSQVHAGEPSGFKDGLAVGKLSELLSRVRG